MARTRKKTAKKKVASKSYETRIILFLDFLAFKEHVQTTENDPAFLGKLLSAIDAVREITGPLEDPEIAPSKQVTQFSDSLVVSFKVDEESAVFYLLLDIAFCLVELIDRGFLMRGAVTIGKLYHTDEHLVGPAMVEAYRLESQIAKYPRVVYDRDKLIAAARRFHSDNHTPEKEAEYVQGLMTQDDDGLYFFDYTSWEHVVDAMGGDHDGFPAYLEGVAILIKKGLGHNNPGVLEKYLWLHGRYIKSLRIFDEIPADHNYRIENPGVIEAICSLPRLEAEAKAALKKIRAASKKSKKKKGKQKRKGKRKR